MQPFLLCKYICIWILYSSYHWISACYSYIHSTYSFSVFPRGLSFLPIITTNSCSWRRQWKDTEEYHKSRLGFEVNIILQSKHRCCVISLWVNITHPHFLNTLCEALSQCSSGGRVALYVLRKRLASQGNHKEQRCFIWLHFRYSSSHFFIDK